MGLGFGSIVDASRCRARFFVEMVLSCSLVPAPE